MAKNDTTTKKTTPTAPDTFDGKPIPPGMTVRHIKGVARLVKAAEADTRPAEVIFADRVESIRLIMQRQFDNLVKVGNARNARPTPAQEAALRNWLAEESDRALDALFGSLHADKMRGSLLTSPDVTPGFKPRK